MKFLIFFKKLFSNKVFIYMGTRYLVYFLTFLSSMIIAARMGPYYLGIWGFITLLLHYFKLINLGIGNSITVLLVQNKEQNERDDYEKSAMVIIGIISLIAVFIGFYYYFFGISVFGKYHLDKLFYFICIIAVFQYFNDYFLKVSRVKGKMFEFTFYQTLLQVLVFIGIFFAKGKELINLLIGLYILAHIISLIIFISGGTISFKGKVKRKKMSKIVSKGIHLFIYNLCFYLIILSTKTIVGLYYSIEEFGYFTFAYTLANAAMLLLSAFSALIMPKLIDKFDSLDKNIIEGTMNTIRINYMYLSHGIIYFAMIFFPLFIIILPQYSGTLKVINLSSLAVVLYSNSYGFISFLMARNKEKVIARNSLICLIVNIIIALLLVKGFQVDYSYVILATLITYLLYAYLTISSGRKELKTSIKFRIIIKEVFPQGILIPFLVAIIVTIINLKYIMFIPFLVYLLLNKKEIKEIFHSFILILNNPKVIDIKN
ncbi:MAG: oligosaccharide flippase family protein [Bacteroidales bacterium]